jgi:hypothetical protein
MRLTWPLRHTPSARAAASTFSGGPVGAPIARHKLPPGRGLPPHMAGGRRSGSLWQRSDRAMLRLIRAAGLVAARMVGRTLSATLLPARAAFRHPIRQAGSPQDWPLMRLGDEWQRPFLDPKPTWVFRAH